MEKRNFALYRNNGELKWKEFGTEEAALEHLNGMLERPEMEPLVFYNPDRDFYSAYAGISPSEAEEVVQQFKKETNEK